MLYWQQLLVWVLTICACKLENKPFLPLLEVMPVAFWNLMCGGGFFSIYIHEVVQAHMLMEVRYYCLTEVYSMRKEQGKSLHAVHSFTLPWSAEYGHKSDRQRLRDLPEGKEAQGWPCSPQLPEWEGRVSWGLVSSPRCQGRGPEEMASSCARWDSGWILGKNLARHSNRLPREVVECPWKCPKRVSMWHLGTVVNRNGAEQG